MGKYTDWAKQKATSITTIGSTLTDEQALSNVGFFVPWRTETAYGVDQIISYGSTLYRCLTAHTSQTTWTPDVTPALWVEVSAPGQYREIKENMLSTEAFALDEIGWWQTKDNLYQSLIANNVYTPETYPAGWRAV